MPRPKGSRDTDYEEKRRELLRKMTHRIMRREVVRPSLRDLAAAADVTVPTLRHYFGGRPQVIEAILEECLRLGKAGLDAEASSDLPFDQSMRDYARNLISALRTVHQVRLSDIFAVSLAEGLLDPQIAGATLRHIFDPTVETLQARLDLHVKRGEMVSIPTRPAAMMMVSPLLMACLHQDQLRGAEMTPMSLDDLADQVSAAFVRAHTKAI